jgi:nitrate reductase gamma subunit
MYTDSCSAETLKKKVPPQSGQTIGVLDLLSKALSRSMSAVGLPATAGLALVANVFSFEFKRLIAKLASHLTVNHDRLVLMVLEIQDLVALNLKVGRSVFSDHGHPIHGRSPYRVKCILGSGNRALDSSGPFPFASE